MCMSQESQSSRKRSIRDSHLPWEESRIVPSFPKKKNAPRLQFKLIPQIPSAKIPKQRQFRTERTLPISFHLRPF